MNASFRQLEAFCAVARLASFTRAAAALHTTQPALSVQIAQLEAALGLRLFDRSTRKVAITSVGRELLPRAERTLAELTALGESARGLASARRGRVAVAALPSIASSFLPAALARFARRHPDVEVAVHDALAGRVVELVREERVDFGLSGEPPPEAGLAFAAFGRDEMVAVAPVGLALGRGGRVTLEALVVHPLILMSRDSSVRRIVDQAFAGRGRLARPAYEPAYMATAVALVREGLGVALLPSSASEVRAAQGVAVHRIAHRGMVRRIGFVARREDTMSPAARALEAQLRAAAKDMF